MFNVDLPEVVVVLVDRRDSHPVQKVVGNLDKPLIIFFSNKASYELSRVFSGELASTLVN